MVGEENRLDGFQRSFIRFSFHLKICGPAGAGEGPDILNHGIRIRFGLAETHIFMGNSVGIARKHCVHEVIREWNDKFGTLKPTP